MFPSYEDLYEDYKNEVFRFACYLTRDRGEAEDLYQEAWLRILRKMPEEANPQRLKAWVFTVVANLHRDLERKKRVRRLFLLQKHVKGSGEDVGFPGKLHNDSSDPQVRMEQEELGMRIQRAISRLPERQRRVFLLKELAGFQQTEISRMLGMPDGTVKSLMHRAVKRLRLELSDRYSQPVEGSVNKCRVKTLSV